ncbi:hypothetical protein ANRL3_01091 [Anaerolineae bacterium]|nr:hypothetical protein ANRL3_01091 [Anaerolineae bacterium]
MSHNKNAFQLMQELLDMPEFQIHSSIQELNTSIYIFEENYNDLRRLVNFLAVDSRSEHLLLLRNRHKLKSVLTDIIRLLHNYVAAAQSLIDHTRRLNRKLNSNSEKFAEYNTRVEIEFVKDSLSQFVKDLRQYCQHYRAPNLEITVRTSDKTGGATKTINLLTDDLRSYERWSPLAKEYLNTAGEKVNIMEVATAYKAKVIRFYDWFRFHIETIHAVELRRLKDKEQLYLEARLRDEIFYISAERKQGFQQKTEKALLAVLDSEDFEELDRIPIDFDRRAIRAIELIERHMVLPQEFKQIITDLYREENTWFTAKKS